MDTLTLTDKIVSTLGPGRFLIATDDEAHAIACLTDAVGAETVNGLVTWYLHNTDDTFILAETLLAAVWAGLPQSPLAAP